MLEIRLQKHLVDVRVLISLPKCSIFIHLWCIYLYIICTCLWKSCPQCSSLEKKTLYIDQSFNTALQKHIFSLTAVSHSNVCLKIFDRSTDQVCFHFRFCKMGAHCNPEVEKSRSAATDRFMFISLVCSNICLVR